MPASAEWISMKKHSVYTKAFMVLNGCWKRHEPHTQHLNMKSKSSQACMVMVAELWMHNDWVLWLAPGQLMTISVSLKCFWGNSWLYLSPPQSPPSPLCGHLVCSGSTQRDHVLSSQCLLNTSLESSWHRQDTTALSTRTSLSLSLPGRSSTAFFYPTCSAPFSSFLTDIIVSCLVFASSCRLCQYVWHHFCCLFFLSCPFFLTLLHVQDVLSL